MKSLLLHIVYALSIVALIVVSFIVCMAAAAFPRRTF